MMHRDKYKFYFTDVQNEAYWDNNYSPRERVTEVQHQLDKALDLWETGNRHVIYDCPWGWFDTDTMRYERDTDSRPAWEAWDTYEASVKRNPEDALPPPIFEMANIDEEILINVPRYF